MRLNKVLLTALAITVFFSGTLRVFASDVPEQIIAESDSKTVIYQIEDNAPLSTVLSNGWGDTDPTLKDVRTVEQGGQTLIVKTWDVPPGFDTEQLVEDDFEKNGLHYKKAYLLQVSENFENQTKLASETVTTAHEKKDDALAKLQPIIEYNQDGFTGQLTLKTDAIVTEAADTNNYSYAVTDTREFTGFERNDTYNIPKSVDKNGVPLQLMDVNWTQMGEGSYKATASYQGTASGTSVSNYISTATYIGEVAKKTLAGATYAVVYEGALIPAPPPDYLPYFLAAGITLLLLIALLALLNRRKNTKVFAMIGREYQLVHKQKISVLSPIVDLTPPEISSGNDEFMIALDRMAVRKMRGQFIKVVGKDGVIKEHRVTNIRHFHIRPNVNEYEREFICSSTPLRSNEINEEDM